jgi:hypothetical protein
MTDQGEHQSVPDAVAEAKVEAARMQAVEDFGRSQVICPLFYASGECIGLVLPESAERLIEQGPKALLVLRRHEHEDLLSQACVMVIEAERVSRGRPEPSVLNGVKMVAYTVVPRWL